MFRSVQPNINIFFHCCPVKNLRFFASLRMTAIYKPTLTRLVDCHFERREKSQINMYLEDFARQ